MVKYVFSSYKYINFSFSHTKIFVRLFLILQKFFIIIFLSLLLVNLCLAFICFNETFQKWVEYYDNLSQKN